MRRIHLSALVLVTWLAMIGWQFRREYFQPELTRLAEAALSLAPGAIFPNLDTTNAAEIPTSFGGLIFMMSAVSYLAVVVILLACR